MQDAFTGKPTFIHGRSLPDAESRAALQHDHQRRLEALARLGKDAAKRAFADKAEDWIKSKLDALP